MFGYRGEAKASSGGFVAFIPHVRPAQVADLAIGVGGPEKLLTTVMGRARGELLQELHTFSSVNGARALRRAAKRGAEVRMLVNARHISPLKFPRSDGAVQMEAYYARTLLGEHAYQHSKLVSSTRGKMHRPEAVFTNVSLMSTSGKRPDTAVRLTGNSASAVHSYLDASFGTDLTRLAQAADDARRGGVLVNEPQTGISHLSDAMRSLVDTAEHRIQIVSKGIDDADFAARLVQARQRGVDVTMSVREIARDEARVLHEGGVRVIVHPAGYDANRINTIVADDLVLASTAYQWKKMLRQGAPSSRESGVLLAGSDAREAVRMLGATNEGTAINAVARGRHLVSLPRGAEPAVLPRGFEPLEDLLGSWRLVSELH
jgi:phosphatidylserine/phosphatidylglycerophosphate/cardiolipin synthase-like enzyme